MSLNWHEQLNQVIMGCADHKIRVLYDPEFSKKGVMYCLKKHPKRRRIEDSHSTLAVQVDLYSLLLLFISSLYFLPVSTSSSSTPEFRPLTLFPCLPTKSVHIVNAKRYSRTSLPPILTQRLVSILLRHIDLSLRCGV